MKKVYPRNTYGKGRARVLVYPEKAKFVAVCLDFGLVEEAATREEALEYIKDAVESHLSTVIKNKLSEDLLNRPAAEKYWRKYREYLKHEEILARFREGLRKEEPREDWTSLAVLHILNLSSPDFNFLS